MELILGCIKNICFVSIIKRIIEKPGFQRYFLFCEAEYPVACCVGSKMMQNLAQRGKFRNARSAYSGDRNFQGFASLLSSDRCLLSLLFQ